MTHSLEPRGVDPRAANGGGATQSPTRARGERLLLAALVVFSMTNIYAWIQVVPLGDGPDETGHLEVVLFELVFRRIPEAGVDDYGAIAKSGADGYPSPLYSYAAQPGLSYIVSAAAVELLGDRSPASVIYARYPGIVWGALMPLAVFWCVARMYPSNRDAAALAAAVSAFWPQLTFIFSYTNNDGLTALAATALVASWFAGARQGWRLRDAIVAGSLVGLVALGKPNGYPIAAMTALAMPLTMREGFRKGVARCAAALGAAVVVSGWWWVIAFRRYGLDLLAERRADAIRESLGVAWASGRTYGLSMLDTAIGRYPRFYAKTWLEGTLTSGVGEFGPLTIALPGTVYALVGAVTCAAFVGLIVVSARRSDEESRPIGILKLLTFALLPLELVLSLYRSWAFDFQAQGRYLFPALISLFALLGAGLAGSISGERARRATGLGTSLLFAAIAMFSFAVVLLDGYRSSLVEFVIARPFAGGLWIAAALFAVAAVTAYWLRFPRCQPADENVQQV